MISICIKHIIKK